MKNKKLMIILLSAVLVLVIVFGVIALRSMFRKTTYDEAVFGKQYAKQINIYAGFFGSYGTQPAYYLSEDGCLYGNNYESGEKTVEKISGAMESIELTKWNFDSQFSGGSWTAMGVDAQYTRENCKGVVWCRKRG